MTDREFAASPGDRLASRSTRGAGEVVAKLVRQMERVQNAEYKKELTAVREGSLPRSTLALSIRLSPRWRRHAG